MLFGMRKWYWALLLLPVAYAAYNRFVSDLSWGDSVLHALATTLMVAVAGVPRFPELGLHESTQRAALLGGLVGLVAVVAQPVAWKALSLAGVVVVVMLGLLWFTERTAAARQPAEPREET